MEKIILISGGTSGIGLATAKLFLSKGANLIIASRSQKKFNQNFGDGNRSRFIETDFNDMDSVKSLYSTIKKEYDTIDIAVNNVGLAMMKPLVDFEEKDFDASMNVNLRAFGSVLRIKFP